VDEDTGVVEDVATGELVAFCATTPIRTDGIVAGDGEIWTIGVRPDRQGAGLGRQLLRWGARRLRSIGVSTVSLSVNGRNERALGLYESDGFVRSRTRERWARPVDAGGGEPS
jgi:mycothiol synthase